MIKLEKEKTKESFINNIIDDLYSMPSADLKMMYVIIHSLKQSNDNKIVKTGFVEEWANDFFIMQSKYKNKNWDILSDIEKEDINIGLKDLEQGRYKDINEVLQKYK